MSETKQQDKGERVAASAPASIENRSYIEILGALAGKVVTVVNPESYESAPLGFQLKTGFYRAKVMGVGKDYVILKTELEKKGKDAGKEPVRQFIPIGRIKRISLLEKERLIHL